MAIGQPTDLIVVHDAALSTVFCAKLVERLRTSGYAQLEAAGLVRLGRCAESGCTGGCCARVMEAQGGARNRPSGAVEFACGKVEVTEVISVTTEGSTATVLFKRTFTPNAALLASLAACKLEAPDKGSVQKDWKFKRDDEGHWRIVE